MDWLNQGNTLLVAICTGSGVFLGALITVIIQGAAGILQRRQERVLKTFEVRMQLYVQFCKQYREASYLSSDLTTLTSKVESVKSRPLEPAEVDSTRVGDRPEEMKSGAERVERLEKELDLMEKNLQGLEIRRAETTTAIDLVSSSQVRQALIGLPGKVMNGGDPVYDMTYLRPFLEAARKDIKISD